MEEETKEAEIILRMIEKGYAIIPKKVIARSKKERIIRIPEAEEDSNVVVIILPKYNNNYFIAENNKKNEKVGD